MRAPKNKPTFSPVQKAAISAYLRELLANSQALREKLRLEIADIDVQYDFEGNNAYCTLIVKRLPHSTGIRMAPLDDMVEPPKGKKKKRKLPYAYREATTPKPLKVRQRAESALEARTAKKGRSLYLFSEKGRTK